MTKAYYPAAIVETKDKCVLAYITCPTREEALALGRSLVEDKLCAGVNIFGPGVSFYRWRGEIHEAGEYALFAQVSKDGFEKFRAAVVAAHSYMTPCVICLDISAGYTPFLDWIIANCRD